MPPARRRGTWWWVAATAGSAACGACGRRPETGERVAFRRHDERRFDLRCVPCATREGIQVNGEERGHVPEELRDVDVKALRARMEADVDEAERSLADALARMEDERRKADTYLRNLVAARHRLRIMDERGMR